jgi:hypothetical protein
MIKVCHHCGENKVDTNNVRGIFAICKNCNKVVCINDMICVEEYKNKNRTKLIDRMLKK